MNNQLKVKEFRGFAIEKLKELMSDYTDDAFVENREADKKYDEVKELQNNLHIGLVALHSKITEWERVPIMGSIADNNGLYTDVKYLHKRTETAERVISLLNLEIALKSDQLERALKLVENLNMEVSQIKNRLVEKDAQLGEMYTDVNCLQKRSETAEKVISLLNQEIASKSAQLESALVFVENLNMEKTQIKNRLVEKDVQFGKMCVAMAKCFNVLASNTSISYSDGRDQAMKIKKSGNITREV